MADSLIQLFVDNLAQQNEESAVTVKSYLQDFNEFASSELNSTPTDIIKNLKQGTLNDSPKEEQPYQVLSKYAGWLKRTEFDKGEISAHTLRLKVSWVRTLMETNFLPISRAVFKQQVKMPKAEEPDLSPVSKKTVQKVILATEDIRMQTYELWLGSMGWRATESFTIQNQNFQGLNLKTLKFEDGPAFVNMSGKTAKTKKGKRRRITAEMKTKLEVYLAHKYRPRTINYRTPKGWKKKQFTPEPKPTDYVFMPYHDDAKPLKKKFAKNAYQNMQQRFADLMDRLGIDYEENGKRHKVTLHTLRRYCFTTCSRAVSEPYAKYHIGRRTHEYKKDTDEQIEEDFAAVEPFLTFFDTSNVEETQKNQQKELARLQTEIERLKAERRIDTRSDEYIVSKLVMEVGDLQKKIREMEGKPEPPKVPDEEFNKMLDEENIKHYGTADITKIKAILREQKEKQIDRELGKG